MPTPDDSRRLQEFEERLARAKRAQVPKPRGAAEHALVQHGWRMVTELVAGLLIGLSIGWGLDALFGTRPLLLVLFVLLGLAAGVRVMLRTAAEVQTKAQAAEAVGAQDKAGAASARGRAHGGTERQGKNEGQGEENRG